jgi:hypothetical protein
LSTSCILDEGSLVLDPARPARTRFLLSPLPSIQPFGHRCILQQANKIHQPVGMLELETLSVVSVVRDRTNKETKRASARARSNEQWKRVPSFFSLSPVSSPPHPAENDGPKAAKLQRGTTLLLWCSSAVGQVRRFDEGVIRCDVHEQPQETEN